MNTNQGRTITRIYTLADPRNPDNIRYVGKTTYRLKHRLGQHLYPKGRNHRTNWINALKNIGLKPVVEELESVDSSNENHQSWQEVERFWISYFRFLGFDLLNATTGGEGCCGSKHSEETKRKRRESRKGYVVSDETKAKLREANKNWKPSAQMQAAARAANLGNTYTKGKRLSKSTRDKMSASRRGRLKSDEHKTKISAGLFRYWSSKRSRAESTVVESLDNP